VVPPTPSPNKNRKIDKMFCLRSWLPLLFIPTNASPVFIFLFFICTYFLNRPCVYCSFLLLILFASSCHWSDHCFFDFSSNWFEQRLHQPTSPTDPFPSASSSIFSSASASISTTLASQTLSHLAAHLSHALNLTLNATANSTSSAAGSLASSALEGAKRRLGLGLAGARGEWTGIGVEWLRSLLGRREWRLPCVDVYIRL